MSLGHCWSEQLAQARRLTIRSSRRGLGHPKQAGGLPLASLWDWANQQELLAAEGPTWPARATLLASWWLLREIEASRARKSHICQDVAEFRITWRLPSSKTDQAALGAYRSHRCSCEFAPSSICPYHLMAAQLESLAPRRWASLFDTRWRSAKQAGLGRHFSSIGCQVGIGNSPSKRC